MVRASPMLRIYLRTISESRHDDLVIIQDPREQDLADRARKERAKPIKDREEGNTSLGLWPLPLRKQVEYRRYKQAKLEPEMQEHSEAQPVDDNLTTLREKRKKSAALQMSIQLSTTPCSEDMSPRAFKSRPLKPLLFLSCKNAYPFCPSRILRFELAYPIRKYIRPNRTGTDRAVKESVDRVERAVHTTPKSELRPASHDFIKGWFSNPVRHASSDERTPQKYDGRYEIMGRLNGGDKAYTYPTIASDWVMLAGSQTRPVHEMWPNSTATASFPIKPPLPPAAKSQILFGFQLRGILSDTRGNLSSPGFRSNGIAVTERHIILACIFCVSRPIKIREYVEFVRERTGREENEPLENLKKYMALKELQDIYSSFLDALAPDAEFPRRDETLEQQVTMVECARLLAPSVLNSYSVDSEMMEQSALDQAELRSFKQKY
ncbi:hypothetical protein EDD85DRAFT_937450 [Armillaria nabsnona]|nr:hypothetical protein EDD85DRAFT_937450 [Armillaria nabsnona]